MWWALDRLLPLPPTHIVMTTGGEGSAYHELGKQYQELLATNGVTVELRPSAGDVENLDRLRDPGSGVDVGFVQGGLTSGRSFPRVVVPGHLALPATLDLLPGPRSKRRGISGGVS